MACGALGVAITSRMVVLLESKFLRRTFYMSCIACGTATHEGEGRIDRWPKSLRRRGDLGNAGVLRVAQDDTLKTNTSQAHTSIMHTSITKQVHRPWNSY